MGDQFERIAADLGWDVERQIVVLEDFITGFGAGGRLEDHLRELGLRASRRPSLVRDSMLGLVEDLGSHGVFSHYLQRQLRQAELERRAAANPVPPPTATADASPPVRRWLPARLRWRRRSPAARHVSQG